MNLMVGLHLFSALGALILGVVLYFLPKGVALHRLIGRIWMGLMLLAALSAFGLSSNMIGFYLSPLHGLAALTLYLIWRAYNYARKGQISAHRKAVWALFWGALVIPGIFAVLLPGRFLNEFVVGWIKLT